ncbi:hypothetical protein BC831DRAFT_463739, partial [Entophlyctis helioformis]
MLSPRQLVRLLPLLLLQPLLLVCAFTPPASLACCRVLACMHAADNGCEPWCPPLLDKYRLRLSPQARPVDRVSCAGREPAAHKYNHRSGV